MVAMHASPRGPRSIALSLVLATACFDDPPSLDGDSGSTASGDSSSSVATDAPATMSTTTDSTSGVDETVDGSTTATDASTDGTSSTTGEPTPRECGCPAENVFCDGFESWPGPWGFPDGGGGTEDQDLEMAYCETASVRTEVSSGATYAVLNAPLATTTGEWVAAAGSVHALVRVSPGCAAEAGFVRVFDFQLRTPMGGHWYAWSVAVAGGQTRLTATNNQLTTMSWTTDALPDDWVELRLDVDFTGAEPSAVLHIGEDSAMESSGAPGLLDGAFSETAAPHVVLGSYFFDTPVTNDCTVWYDDVWAAPS